MGVCTLEQIPGGFGVGVEAVSLRRAGARCPLNCCPGAAGTSPFMAVPLSWVIDLRPQEN